LSDAADPDENETIEPTPTQRRIINSDEYPMRVLAGAGTGKTFTMVRKIKRLLDNDVPPEDILALTFTNKAADSIREKLVAEIGPRANDIDAYTYHAIGETILRDHAYQAGLDPRYEIATEVDQLQFIYESLDAIPYWFTNPRVAAPEEHGAGVSDQLATFVPQMKGEDIRPDDLQAYLGPPDRLIMLGELIDRLEERAEELFDYGRWRKPTAERLEDDMILPLETYKADLQNEQERLTDTGLESDIAEYLDRLIGLCDALIRLFEKRQNDIIDGPLKPTFRLPALLFNAKFGGDATGLPELDQTPLDRLRDVIETCQTARDLTEGYDEYSARLDDADMVDFGDLVTRSRALFAESQEGEAEGTEATDARETLGLDWEYVFCDEFQDTDTVQFDLVADLVGGGDLFVVGDTYQAIYEWRGANITNITDRLTARFGPTDISLDENFRSHEPILRFANNAFHQHPDRDSIDELEPAEKEQEVERGVAAITAPPDEDSRRTVIDEDGEAALLVEGIMQLLSGETDLVTDADLARLEDDDRDAPDGYRPEDIAILVRATRHARPIIDALEVAGIPYTLGGSLAAESLGVRTVIAYLKVLTKPERDESLNRVLTMRYRLHDADLQTLNQQDDSLYKTLLAADLDALGLVEPERVKTARTDLDHLLAVRDSHSLSGLYEELKDISKVEWFLSETERSDLEYLDEVVAEYGRDHVQPELSEEFIEFLQYNATTVLEGGGAVQDQPDTTPDAVNIMTVHKSKGLEFPVVVLPQLTAEEWDPRQQSNAPLRQALRDDNASPFDTDLVRRDEFEQRRAFHVAVTRARNLCVLSGRAEDPDEDDDDDDDTLSRDETAALLPEDMAWCLHPNTFPVWETVQTSLPASAVDWTADLQEALESERDAVIRTSSGEEMAISDAYDTVLSAAEAAVDGTAPSVDPETFGLPATPVEPAPIDLLPQHSPTSISTGKRCPRKHYLEYVVDAFEDPNPDLLGDEFNYAVGTNVATSRSATESGVSRREVGVLFHKTAERADQQSYATSEAREQRWRTIAQSLGDFDDAVRDEVLQCIDMFFETEASEWTVQSTERWFDFIYDDTHRIVGKIDAVCEKPTGDVVILDYKTGRQRNPDNNDNEYQLPIYMYAANASDMIGNVDKAALVYVNADLKLASRVDEVRYNQNEVDTQMKRVRAVIDDLEQATYATAEPDAGIWCYECGHRSLPCSTTFDEDR